MDSDVFCDSYLEYYDRYVYNDLPQYLMRTNDMKLISRDDFCSRFRYLAEDRVRAIARIGRDGSLSEEACKNDIKELLKYAIFSHRWGKDEPSFKIMSRRKWTSPKGAGCKKLRRLCEIAKAEYHCEYVWSDTCCINKESSADLDEAIRSMFRWYTNAYICIAYLAKSHTTKDFRNEPWFTRGWTLQELLAAKRLRMFGKDWIPICPPGKDDGREQIFPFPNDKQNDFMLQAIHLVTGIRVDCIRSFSPTNVSVSERMRWASERKTTRVEDVAYSLLGIFDVSMPIAYGEGSDRAFRRLLDVIAQSSHDPSLFAWSGPCSRYSHSLPSSPASYKTEIDIDNSRSGGDSAYTIQKRGVQIKLLLIHVYVIRSGNDQCTLKPVDENLASNISIHGGFSRDLQRALDDGYVVGVVNFDLCPTRDDVGRIKVGRSYFGMILERSQGSVLGFGLCSRRQETDGPLLTITCMKNDHEGPLTTVCVLH